MKRSILFLMAALLVVPVMAKKNWNFELNKKGNCVIERTFKTSLSGKEALANVRQALSDEKYDYCYVTEKAGKSLNCKIRNIIRKGGIPRVGTFTESMEFNMVVTYTKGAVKVSITNPTFEYKYDGYAEKNERTSFNTKIKEYQKAEKDLESTDKDTKNKAKLTIKEIDHSFGGCQKALDKMFKKIEKML